jgi:hypothetical protein
LVRTPRSASEQRPSGDGNAQPDKDGEPEHGVGWAGALVQRDSGALTTIPGIGPWTAQGALILALRREDVVRPGDLALRRQSGVSTRSITSQARPRYWPSLRSGGRTAVRPRTTCSPPPSMSPNRHRAPPAQLDGQRTCTMGEMDGRSLGPFSVSPIGLGAIRRTGAERPLSRSSDYQ